MTEVLHIVKQQVC